MDYGFRERFDVQPYDIAQSRAQARSSRRFFSFAAIKGHNPWLDVLRAIAVMLVLLRHGERAVMGLSPEALSLIHI